MTDRHSVQIGDRVTVIVDPRPDDASTQWKQGFPYFKKDGNRCKGGLYTGKVIEITEPDSLGQACIVFEQDDGEQIVAVDYMVSAHE